MPNRYLCDVLEEMRKLNETRNYSSLLGLIEEAQWMANRMEGALGANKDYRSWHEKAKNEKLEFNKLRKEADGLRKKVGKKPKGQKENSYSTE